MSNTFAVDTARIAAASADIERIASSIESEVRTMMAKLTALGDCWQGAAAGGFQAVTQEWSGTQEQVRTSLQHISTTLRVAGHDYEQVEHTNRLRFVPQ